MKTVVLTPSSSWRTPSAAVRNRSDGRGEGWYFPGCRKDANCHCEICLASIHATLDLIPSGSSITNLSASRSVQMMVPVPFDGQESPPLTPKAVPIGSPNQQTRSTLKSRWPEKPIRTKKSGAIGCRVLGILACLCLIWAVDSGVLAVILKDWGPRLTPEAMKQLGEESRAVSGGLGVRLVFLQQKIEGFGLRVSNCSSGDSKWGFHQRGNIFFHWRCVIYQSVAEEVSLWGTPIQTSGLLPTGFSPRSIVLLSGRITEWSEETIASTSRAISNSSSSSWTTRQWSSTAVQLEADTWALQYSRSVLFHGQGWGPAVRRVSSVVRQDPWSLLALVPLFPAHQHHTSEEGHLLHPT